MSSALDIHSSKPTTPTKQTKPKQPTKSKTKKTVQAFLRQNFEAIETLGWRDPCYVNFRNKFAGLGVFYGTYETSLPRPGAGFRQIPTDCVFIPYVVMNRFGLVVSPHRAVCKFKSSVEGLGRPLCIDKSRRLTINHTVYACPPCHEQDNWSATWKYRLEIGSCKCTLLDGQIVVRPVVNITDQPWSGTTTSCRLASTCLFKTLKDCGFELDPQPDKEAAQKASDQLCINMNLVPVKIDWECDSYESSTRNIPSS